MRIKKFDILSSHSRNGYVLSNIRLNLTKRVTSVEYIKEKSGHPERLINPTLTSEASKQKKRFPGKVSFFLNWSNLMDFQGVRPRKKTDCPKLGVRPKKNAGNWTCFL